MVNQGKIARKFAYFYIFSYLCTRFRKHSFMRMNFTPPHSKAIRLKDNHIDSTTRDSNIELLRLIAMYMIVLHHFIVHSCFPDVLDISATLSTSTALSTCLDGFLYIGVNCFILISGYYGVRLKVKSILNLYLTCLCYGLIGYLLHIYVSDASLGRTLIYNSVFIFSHSQWWYISCYIGLLLLSPIINVFLSNASKYHHQLAILSMTILSVYLGYLWHNPDYDIDGYSLLQFIYLYIIGNYLRKYLPRNFAFCHRKKLILCYITSSLVWGAITCCQHLINIPCIWNPWAYNNPIIIFSSISFFLLFISFSFQSKKTNWLASGTLAAYLLQDQLYIGKNLYPKVASLFEPLSYMNQIAYLLLLSIIFILVAIFIEKLRQRICKPLIDILIRLSTSLCAQLPKMWPDNKKPTSTSL